MRNKSKILVIGALGRIGTELTAALRQQHGWQNVLAADIYPACAEKQENGPYFKLDVLNKTMLGRMVGNLNVGQIQHLAAVLSANSEADRFRAWEINMQGLLNVLEVSRKYKIDKIFWPSSIAVFGSASMRAACPQHVGGDPMTVYGISKQAGEYWCRYYHQQYGLDVRSIRFPGLVSHAAKPGGGITDYAVEIFHAALESGRYTCYLKENTGLPMMYMPDAIRATLELMETPEDRLSVRTSYNLAAINFTPRELAAEITKHIPDLKISYAPDNRQDIADSWPSSSDDRFARHEWGWQPRYKLADLVSDMLSHLRKEAYA